MRPGKQMVRGLILVGIRIAQGLAHFLPWHWGTRIGRLLGITAYYLLSKERQKVIDHLHLAFADKLSSGEIRSTARACFAHLGMGFLELLNLPRLGKDRLADLVEIEGEENLFKPMSQGRGVIYISGHIGNWELMAVVVALKGYPLKVIAAPIYDKRLDALMTRHRARFGIETIQRGSTQAARQILSGLRKGYMLAFLIDQDIQMEGTYVDFFGHSAYTPIGPTALALHSEVPVVLGYTHRLENGRHRIIFEEPLTLVRTGNSEADIQSNTALFTKHLEGFIRRRPEQWVWMHRRWATAKPSASGEDKRARSHG